MSKNKNTTQTWDMVIRPQGYFVGLQLGEVWKYRELIYLFVRRNFVAYYKQTILGPFWYLITPILSALIFTVIFGKVAKLPTDGIPPFLFYMAGNITWSYFASSFTTTSNAFVTNAAIFGKVYFPRLTVPISDVISGLFRYGIQLSIFIVFYIYFVSRGTSARPTLLVLCFPFIILQISLLSLGFGIIVSSLTTKYRDITMLVAFGVQLWMFATPIVYPASLVPEKYLFFYELNPMVSVIESFRYAFLGQGILEPGYIAMSWGITLVFLFTGIILFNKVEKTFMDTV